MELFSLIAIILLGLIWVLLGMFREQEASIQLHPEREWHPHPDGVHECRYFVYLAEGHEWQKEWEIRKRELIERR